jgi:hypothetical protein
MSKLPSIIADFAETARVEALRAFAGLRDTGTLAPGGTITFVERVPGERVAVSFRYPGPFKRDASFQPVAFTFEGELLAESGRNDGGGIRYLPVLLAHDHITSVAHVHTPYLGAWAQAHRSLPVLYVPVQRWTYAREIPIYIDRTVKESSFIVEALNAEPTLPAILEANGGATAFGARGLLTLAETIVLLEEGARMQAIAEGLGGAREYGPGVLEQQWKRTGLAA